MLFHKNTGVLLHPTSLPGKWGIGTLGSEARQFAKWMSDSNLDVWQVLPVAPPVYANSPYQALSSFAGNPLLISPEELFKMELLTASELSSAEIVNENKVSWNKLSERISLLKLAATRALDLNLPGFDNFQNEPQMKEWCWFAANKSMNRGKPWIKWQNSIIPDQKSIQVQAMIQFLFKKQWQQMKNYCNSLGIKIIGDIPIYTAFDSADVFFNRNLFKLDEHNKPSAVAGVPPDYFSKTGQLWGNPVYDWQQCADSKFKWWTNRLKSALQLFDVVRIDHFRGFAEYWEIPAGEKTAENGNWVKGPGIELFREMEKKLGKLPVIAEDLGLITPSVHKLRKLCGFPGMVVLQFALQDPTFALDKIDPNSIIYTGTHDNDTTAGWIESTGKSLGLNSVSSIIEKALNSPAALAIFPMQDFLELGSWSRMNTPSVASGNWSWRMKKLAKPVAVTRPT